MTVDEPPNENNEQTLDNLLKNDKTLHKKELKDETKSSVLPQPARYLFTLALAAGFLGMGSSLSILGLTFPTLAANLHKTINDLPTLVVVRGGGYLAGSLFIGLLESKCNLMVLSVSPLFAIAVGMLMTPLILDVVALHVSTAIAAIGLGAYETVGNVLCLYLWGKKAEPVLQFLHFCYCFGSAMTPFLARPFLNEVFHNTSGMNGSLSMYTESASIPNITFIEGSTVPLVSVPYLVIASFVALVVIFMLAVTFLTSIDLNESQQENTIEQEGTHFRCGMLFLMFLFYFLYVGVEVSFSLFIYKFGISEPPGPAYSRDVSTHLSAMFHFTIVASQFFAIFWSQKFSPGKILAVDFVGLGVGAMALILFPLYSQTTPVLLWIAVGAVALFGTSIYATTFLWAESYITVNGRAASIFIIGGSLGEMILSIPISLLIEKMPLSFVYLSSSYVFALVIVFIISVKFAHTKGRRHSDKNKANNGTSKDDEMFDVRV